MFKGFSMQGATKGSCRLSSATSANPALPEATAGIRPEPCRRHTASTLSRLSLVVPRQRKSAPASFVCACGTANIVMEAFKVWRRDGLVVRFNKRYSWHTKPVPPPSPREGYGKQPHGKQTGPADFVQRRLFTSRAKYEAVQRSRRGAAGWRFLC